MWKSPRGSEGASTFGIYPGSGGTAPKLTQLITPCCLPSPVWRDDFCSSAKAWRQRFTVWWRAQAGRGVSTHREAAEGGCQKKKRKKKRALVGRRFLPLSLSLPLLLACAAKSREKRSKEADMKGIPEILFHDAPSQIWKGWIPNLTWYLGSPCPTFYPRFPGTPLPPVLSSPSHPLFLHQPPPPPTRPRLPLPASP